MKYHINHGILITYAKNYLSETVTFTITKEGGGGGCDRFRTCVYVGAAAFIKEFQGSTFV